MLYNRHGMCDDTTNEDREIPKMFTPVRSVSIVDEIVKKFKDAIIDGSLKPGQKIPSESELCETMGIGRNSLREAVKMLAAVGVLEIRRGDGTYIAKKVTSSALDSLIYSLMLEQSTAQEILELRQVLETDVLEMAVSKAGPEEVKKLEELLESFEQALKLNDIDRAAALDMEFHLELSKAAGNPMLAKITSNVYALFNASVRKTLHAMEHDYSRACQNHREMIAAIKNRRLSEASDIVKRSLETWKTFVK